MSICLFLSVFPLMIQYVIFLLCLKGNWPLLLLLLLLAIELGGGCILVIERNAKKKIVGLFYESWGEKKGHHTTHLFFFVIFKISCSCFGLYTTMIPFTKKKKKHLINIWFGQVTVIIIIKLACSIIWIDTIITTNKRKTKDHAFDVWNRAFCMDTSKTFVVLYLAQHYYHYYYLFNIFLWIIEMPSVRVNCVDYLTQLRFYITMGYYKSLNPVTNYYGTLACILIASFIYLFLLFEDCVSH